MMSWVLRFLILATSCFVSLHNAYAQTVPVSWYAPFSFSPPMTNHLKITLYGKTEPRAQVSVDREGIISDDATTLKSISDLAMDDVLSSVADSSGFFQLSLSLPQGLVQLPVKLNLGSRETVYVLSLQVSRDKTSIGSPTGKDSPEISVLRDKLRLFILKKYGLGVPLARSLSGTWLSIGAGANLQLHSQSLSSQTQLKFNSVGLPSFGARASHSRETWLFNVDYKYQPGKLGKISAPFKIADRDYVWSSLMLEGGYHWKNNYFGEKARFTYLFGLQQHSLPFFRVESGNLVTITNLQANTLSAGAMLTLEFRKKYIAETYMHYQFPLSVSTLSQSTIDIDSKFAFDGSIGGLYRFKEAQYLGLFWLGQWHSYQFTFFNTVDSSETHGDQSLFYSNLEFRYIWKF